MLNFFQRNPRPLPKQMRISKLPPDRPILYRNDGSSYIGDNVSVIEEIDLNEFIKGFASEEEMLSNIVRQWRIWYCKYIMPQTAERLSLELSPISMDIRIYQNHIVLISREWDATYAGDHLALLKMWSEPVYDEIISKREQSSREWEEERKPFREAMAQHIKDINEYLSRPACPRCGRS